MNKEILRMASDEVSKKWKELVSKWNKDISLTLEEKRKLEQEIKEIEITINKLAELGRNE